MGFLDSKVAKVIFGGDPRENHRRYLANEHLKWLIETTDPWTEEALKAAVRKWLDGEET